MRKFNVNTLLEDLKKRYSHLKDKDKTATLIHKAVLKIKEVKEETL